MTARGHASVAALAELRRRSKGCIATQPAALGDRLSCEIDSYASKLRSAAPGLPESPELIRFLHTESLANLIDCTERTLLRADVVEARYQIDDRARDAVCAGFRVPASIAQHSERVLRIIFERIARETALLAALQNALRRGDLVFKFEGATFTLVEARMELIPFFEKR